MARRYTIEFNYNASIVVDVEGEFHDEGEALDKAREIAEDADINEFTIGEERSQCTINIVFIFNWLMWVVSL